MGQHPQQHGHLPLLFYYKCGYAAHYHQQVFYNYHKRHLNAHWRCLLYRLCMERDGKKNPSYS